MKITGDAIWTSEGNWTEIECTCTKKFMTKANKKKVQCPYCKETSDLFLLREKDLLEWAKIEP
jgi:hypothetical protein